MTEKTALLPITIVKDDVPQKGITRWNLVGIVIYTLLEIILITTGIYNKKNCGDIPLWAIIHGSIWITSLLGGVSINNMYLNAILLVGFIGTWIWGMVIVFPCDFDCQDDCYFQLYKFGLTSVIIPWIYIVMIVFDWMCRVD